MAWPLSQDYNEAVQNPSSSFADAELCGGEPVLNAMGMPQPRSGNFADVYEFKGVSGARWAVKCFTREVPGLRERYAEISKFLLQAKLPFTVDFKYLDNGLRIRGQWYPVLKMQWVDGFLLNEFIRCNLDKPPLLDGLGQIWMRMGKRLYDAKIAHADLQHGNVILIPGSRNTALAVKLIDYDGMFVPALATRPSGEVGHPSYQHPLRIQERVYSAQVDRLPLLAVACGLRALAVGGQALWDRHDNGDNLLFREADLKNPGSSEVLRELWNIRDPDVHYLTGHLALALSGTLEQVPLLHELSDGRNVKSLSAAQEQQVTSLLGPGAKVARATSTAVTAKAKSTAVQKGAAPASAWEDLDDEPYRSTVKRPQPVRKSVALPLVITAGVLAAAALGGVGFWMLSKKSEPVQPAPAVAQKPPRVADPLKQANPPEKPGEANVPPPVAVPAKENVPPPDKEIAKTVTPKVVTWGGSELLIYGAEVEGDHIRIAPRGRVETKSKYTGPVEVTFEARCQKSMAVRIRQQTFGFSLSDTTNWHKVRFLPVADTLQFWLDDKRVANSPLVPASQPGTVRVLTVEGESEIKSFVVKTAADRPAVVVAARDTAGLRVPEEILCADMPRQYQIGKDFRIAKDWRLSLDYWVPDQEKDERILFAWGEGNQFKSPILLKQTGKSVVVWLQGSGYFGANLPPDVMRQWIPIRLEYKPSSRQVVMYLGEAKTLWPQRDLLPVEPGPAWLGGVPGRSRFAGKIRNLRLENSAAAAVALKPSAEPKPMPTPEKTPVAIKRDKLPAPTPKAIAAADKEIRSAYANEFNRAAKDGFTRRSLIVSLRNQGKTSEDPASRYLCYRYVRDLEVQDRKYAAAIETVQQMNEEFLINPVEEMVKVLAAALAGSQKNSYTDMEIFIACLKVLNEVKKADAFTSVNKVAAYVQAIALRNPKERDYVRILDERVKLFKSLEKEYKKVKKLYPLAQADPPDPKACKAVGRYWAFLKQDWSKGLPLLVASGDDSLAGPARKDLENPGDPQAQVELGNAWMALADKETPLAKTHIQERAKHWFLKALFALPEENRKAVEDRLKMTLPGGAVLRPGLAAEFLKGFKSLKQKVDYKLDFPNGFAVVDPQIPANGFLAKWKGYLWLPEPGVYDIRANSEGTYEISLDNKRLLFGTEVRSNTTTSRLLFEGLHPVEITFQSLQGNATFQLTWTVRRAGNPNQPWNSPGLFYHVTKKR
jgi:hypothetical protein